MEKEFKEIIEESKKSLEKAEKKIEDLSEGFTEEAGELWVDLKKRFSGVNDKLKDAYDDYERKAELKGHLAMMEAHDKLEQIKESAEKFAFQASKKTETEFDIAALKTELAKMDAKDQWEETKKELSQQYGKSKIEVENLSKKAGKEINEIFLKLTDIV